MNILKSCLYILIVVPIFFVHASQRGGWVSGGGEILKDSLNPWFLQNTKTVYYCIKIDEKNFGLTKKAVNSQIKKAIKFWAAEFTLLGSYEIGQGQNLEIATQNFVQVECNNKTDVVFQFGVLSNEQEKYLVNPKDYLAVSVRTDYDVKTLKTKGFLYFSPVHGNLAFSNKKKMDNFWSAKNKQSLYLGLVHEIGHVFGLPHIGNIYDIMSKSFLDHMLKAFPEAPIKLPLNFFSLPKESNKVCMGESNQSWHSYFDVPKTENCFQFKFEHSPDNEIYGDSVLKLYTSSSNTEPLKFRKEIKLELSFFFPDQYLGTIYLPVGQKVFDHQCVNFLNGNEVLGTSLMSYTKTGSFKLKNKKSRGISVIFHQGSSIFSLQLVVNNQIVTLL